MKLYVLTLFLTLLAWYLSSNGRTDWHIVPILSSNYHFYFPPENVITPSTLDELVNVIQAANDAGRKVRVVGSGHSMSPLAVSAGTLLSLINYRGVIRLDEHAKEVTVKGGTTLNEVNDILEERGYALSILPSISHQTVAGAISTATHSAGSKYGNLATLVTQFKLLLANGTIVTCEKGTDFFNASLVSLGLLGVITQVTFQFEKRFDLIERQEAKPLNYCIEHFEDLINSAEYVKLWLEMNSDTCIVYQLDRTDQKPTNNPSLTALRLRGMVYEMVEWLSNQVPVAMGKLMIKLLIDSGVVFPVHERVGSHRDIFYMPLYQGTHHNSEISVSQENCVMAISKLIQFVKNVDMVVNDIVEVRMVAGDEFWLSPSYGRPLSCFLTLLLYDPSQQQKDLYFGEVHRLTSPLSGRPHWGKEFHSTLGEMTTLYPKLINFLSLQQELDSKGIFLNEFLESTFI